MVISAGEGVSAREGTKCLVGGGKCPTLPEPNRPGRRLITVRPGPAAAAAAQDECVRLERVVGGRQSSWSGGRRDE